MKKRPYLSMNFPPVKLVLVFVVIVGGTYQLDSLFSFPTFVQLRSLSIILSALALGAWRIMAFYPYPAGKYGKWLTLTPWQYGTRLPGGSVHLNVTDILSVGVLCSSTLLDKKIPVVTPPAVFLYAYIVVATISTANGVYLQKYWLKRFLILAIIPFAFCPTPSVENMLLSLVACYLLVQSLLRDVLKDFPWNHTAWLESAEGVLKKASLKYAVTGWPYSALAADGENQSGLKKRLFAVFLPCVLIIWWLHASLPLIFDNGGSRIGLSLMFCYLAFAGILIRLSIYLIGTAPPVSFLGRIMNGYCIIPKYDQIFIAPLAVVILAIVSVYFMPESSLYAIRFFEGVVFLLLLILLRFPPSLNQWRNTGAFRIIRSKMHENQVRQADNNRKGVLNKPVVDFIVGK